MTQIWYDNVPHPKLVEYKKDQHWVVKSGDHFVFPGGGTQFKEGVANYIQFIEKVYFSISFWNLKQLESLFIVLSRCERSVIF